MPPKLTASELVEKLYEAVPPTGEIPYPQLAETVTADGNRDALAHLFPLKHQGRLKVRTEVNTDTGVKVTYVSRA